MSVFKKNISRIDLPRLVQKLGEKKLRNLFMKMKKEQYLIYEKYLKKIKGKHLDVGPGDGITSLYIKTKNPQMFVYMLDLEDSLLTQKVKVKLRKDNFFNHRIYNEKESFPFKKEYFDSISFFYVLHHCKDPLKVLLEARRVLKQRGYIIVLEETAESELGKRNLKEVDLMINKIFNQNSQEANEGISFFEEKELLKLFNQAGLMIIETIIPKVEQELFPRKIYILKQK